MKSPSQFHGLLLVSKAAGMTSHDVVARVRRIFQTRAVGHCGTLDPLAEGLMVLMLNEATKLSQYILEGDKAYDVKLRLGVRTETLDLEGQILEEKPVNVSSDQVQAEAQRIQGDFQWAVPLFSAVKVAGKKLYEYGRQDQAVERPVKLMKFWDVKFMGTESGSDYQFSLACRKGSYIRSWVDELGQRLGCGAMMTGLLRTYSAPFHLSQALKLEDIEKELLAGRAPGCLIPLSLALPQIKRARVKGMDQKLLSHGQISQDLRIQLIQIFDPDQDQVVQVVSQETGDVLALVGLEPGSGFVLRRVLSPSNDSVKS